MEKKKIKIGYIGLGRRGMSVLRGCISQMDDVEVAYLCDLSQSRLEKGRKVLSDNGRAEPILTTNYKDILEDPEVDAVMIMIWWNGRPQMAMDSMRAGKYTAIEVGCASTLDECFALVDTYEETGTPLMMLENCCYGRRELMVLNMVKHQDTQHHHGKGNNKSNNRSQIHCYSPYIPHQCAKISFLYDFTKFFTSCLLSFTIIFFPVTKEITVSGVSSTTSINWSFTRILVPFNLVNSIMFPPLFHKLPQYKSKKLL